MIKIALLGSTGSIGRQVLSVVRRYPDKFKIITMAAGSNAVLFSEQINEFKPKIACLTNPEKVSQIKEIPLGTQFYYGENALLHAVDSEADIVFDAVMGYAGLKAVKYAIELKKNVALANKETLVAGGSLIMPMAKEAGVNIIPVDSEHSAIFQCLNFNANKQFKNILITASGGALRNVPIEELEKVSANDALMHPNWNMGKKITIDCATMVNKGFEVIEAMWLFNAKRENIKVVVHPESIVHSLVEFDDGAIMAQMGVPSMELPIQLALTYPERLPIENHALNLYGKTLNFSEIDKNRYPCFDVVDRAIKLGGVYPCAISAADERIVELFLQGKIKYTEIAIYLEKVLEKIENISVTFDSLEYVDRLSRIIVDEIYKIRGSL
ncbi:MAG: 1-deoxy-D-xylulose-5-phosphate reductoisomerase [Clostridiales bacterium]|nr:1-deoxy-D-xylulose-5-phosphate reductoisomerase [Clostridiales bacterium]